MSLFGELKRRNVFRVGVAYLVTAWLLLQVIDVVTPILELPNWLARSVLLLLSIGLPIALVFAWAFEITPEGVKRESEVDRSESITGQTGRKLNVVIIGVLSLAVAFFAIERFVLHDHDSALVANAVAIDKSIAVLPFANRSAAEDDAYFADGVHDDILTQLHKVSGIEKVISRTSVERYRSSELSIPEIANELGVATIMEGSVQRAGNRVRVTAQLIRADADQQIWAENFDRELTTENVFEIQSEISRAIAGALQATLSPEEASDLAVVPTRNLEAYDAYLLGKQYLKRRDVEEMKVAREYLREAVSLDPEFALGYVAMADANNLLSVWSISMGFIRAESDEFWGYMSHAEAAAERALAINPRLGEAHAALGYTNWQQGVRFSRKAGSVRIAEENFLRALEIAPNYADAYRWYAQYVQDIQVSGIYDAPAIAERAVELDPANAVNYFILGNIYDASGDVENAIETFDRALELDSSTGIGNFSKVNTLVDHGRFAEAITEGRRQLLVDIPARPRYFIIARMAEAYLMLGMEEQRDQMSDLLVSSGLAAPVAFASFLRSFDASDPEVVIRNAESLLAAWNLCDECITEIAISNMAANRPESVLTFVQSRRPEVLGGDLFIGRHHLVAPVAWALIETGQDDAGRELMFDGLDFVAELPYHGGIYGRRLAEVDMQIVAGDLDAAADALAAAVENGWRNRLQLVHPIYDAIRGDPRFVAAIDVIEQDLEAQRQWLAGQEASGAVPPLADSSAM